MPIFINLNGLIIINFDFAVVLKQYGKYSNVIKVSKLKYTYLITLLMNIIAEQLNSKPTTQAMLVCYLLDMKEYFKKAALLSEDKNYTRIFKMAETTEKYIPHFYCFTNIALKLINNLRMKVDDKFEDIENQKLNKANGNQSQDSSYNQDMQLLGKLQIKLSKQKDASNISFNKGRQVNQQYMRKLVIDCIEDIKQQIAECEDTVSEELALILDNDSTILFFDSHLSNKSIISKISTSKKINLKHVKISDADPKNNEINISDVAAQIRRVHKVIISAESILKNGAVIANSGSLMVALAAKKYNIPVIIVARGFSLTQKTLIDQHVLLAENPMKFFKKSEKDTLKVFVGKRFDLIESRLITQVVTELGVVNPANLQIFFATHYDYN